MKVWSVFLVGFLVLGLAAGVEARSDMEVVQAPMVVAPDSYDAAASASSMAKLHGRLMAGRADAVPINLGPLDAAEKAMLDSDLAAGQRRMLVGIDRRVDEAIDLAVVDGVGAFTAKASRVGAVHQLLDGTLVWTAEFRSPGATAVRAHISDVALPESAALYVYNIDGEAFGPYLGSGQVGDGEIWTNTVGGDTLMLQLEIAPGYRSEDLFTAYFELASVGHMGSRFELMRWRQDSHTKSFCTSGTGPINESCVENASCASIPSAIQPAQDAIAEMLFASGSYYYICTGGLLNDTASSGTNYFLTAHHCISTSSEASSLETYWDFIVPCGTTACDYAWAGGRATPGATLLATGSTSDYTLLLLPSVPAGRAYLGWTNTAVAFANGTNLYRIHHPSGAPQSYSTHHVDTSKGTCGSWPRGGWIYSDDDYGATESGSSGSPVMISTGQVVGQLNGACGTNPEDPCDDTANATVDGAFANYYSNVSAWLDPSGCTPSEEICDGIDNDCDGLIDEDGVCDPTCKDPGERCTTNSECCSNRCRGRRIKYCR